MADDGSQSHRTLERIRELDHAHRTRQRTLGHSPMGLALRLRLLRVLASRLGRAPDRIEPVSVPKPHEGSLAISFVGHATCLLSTASTRVLTDPMFGDTLFGFRRARAARLHLDDAQEVSLILVSHAHRDHLHIPSLQRLPRVATLVVPPRCEPLVARLGFSRVIALEPGQDFVHRDLTITAVAARHDSTGPFSVGWRGACGYVIRAPAVSVYFAGDTGYFSGFAEIGRRMHPDVALLPISGYQPLSLREGHLSPLDAVAAFEDLQAKIMIPIAHGSFPMGYEPLEAPELWLREIVAQRGLAANVAILEHGETLLVRPPKGGDKSPPAFTPGGSLS